MLSQLCNSFRHADEYFTNSGSLQMQLHGKRQIKACLSHTNVIPFDRARLYADTRAEQFTYYVSMGYCRVWHSWKSLGFLECKSKARIWNRNRKSNRFGSLISHKVIWAWFLLQRKPLIHVFDTLFTFHHRLCCCPAFPKKNIYFLFPLFQKLGLHWCFYCADGDNISALYHNFFLLFLQYKMVLHTNWFHLGRKHAWHGRSEFPKGAVNYLSYQNRKMTYIKILQITTKSWNYNLISSGKLSPQHLGVEGQKLPIFVFHQLGRAGFPLPSSLLISPALFFSLCPIWPSEPDWLWSSLAAC